MTHSSEAEFIEIFDYMCINLEISPACINI